MISPEVYLQYRRNVRKLKLAEGAALPVLFTSALVFLLTTKNIPIYFVFMLAGMFSPLFIGYYSNRRYGRQITEFARFAINKYLREMSAGEI